jgi:hypothetical protein
MKLRIKDNSLRLRLGPSEIANLLHSGRVEGSIRFAREESAVLTYALELAAGNRDPSACGLRLRYTPHEITVLLSRAQAQEWAESDQVGISGVECTGQSSLELLIEKDFACLDRRDEHNEDTFPNPKAGVTC